MANTTIADIITPDVWADYSQLYAATLSALWMSGLVATVPGITLPVGGGTVNMPFWGDLSGDAENLSDSAALTPGEITAGKDVAVVLGRGRAWSANDLAGVFAGSDPAQAIMRLLANYWEREQQKELIKVLTGAMGASNMTGNVLDISAETGAAAVISGDTFIDATQLLGDHKDQVTGIAMHSAVEAKLAKDGLIDTVQAAGQSDRVRTYMGKNVIVDDSMPVASGVYTSYIFGPGAIGHAEQPIGASDLETDRDILAGDSVIAMRRRFLMHPRGIKWTGTPAGAFPSRTELATAGNWSRVYDPKQIRIVQFKHRIAPAS